MSLIKSALKRIIPLKLRRMPKTLIKKYCESMRNRRLKTELERLIEKAPSVSSISKVLDFVNSCSTGNESVVYTPRLSIGCMYNDVYALLLKGLLLDEKDRNNKAVKSLIENILRSQDDDGLFRDLSIKNEIAETEDWWGWRHLAVHASNALALYGVKPEKPFSVLEPLYGMGAATKWVACLDWENNACNESNKIMNYGVMLQYERDFKGNKKAKRALAEIFEWLNLHQDAKTGLWGLEQHKAAYDLSIGVQTAYHIWILYFYEGRPIQYIERCIDSCLRTQNKLGGFGEPWNSSACEDIDSIDPLCRFYFMKDYRRDDIKKAFLKSISWILANQNEDGGFVFRRFEPLEYGHELLATKPDESGLFPTWFRTLALAYISKVIPEHPLFTNTNFHFSNCPGYQFWVGN